MVPIACAILHYFIKQEKIDDIFDNIGEAIPDVVEGSSSRRNVYPIRKGDYDVSEYIATQFS